MTIHSDHPFLSPEAERSPLRRFRGRMVLPVTLWTAGYADRRAGWTVSSLMVADGQPAELLGLVDQDCDLADLAIRSGRVAVSLLGWEHRGLADAFAGLAPAPGGPFRLAGWTHTAWGPVLTETAAWLGANLVPGRPGHAGWGLLIRAVVAEVHLSAAAPGQSLGYLHGRYLAADVNG